MAHPVNNPSEPLGETSNVRYAHILGSGRNTERYTPGLQWINLGYLFFIAILPLPTRLLSDYGPTSSLVVILYAVVIGVTALFQFWIWTYARRAGLFSSVVDDGMYRYSRRNILPLPIIFGRYLPKAERQAGKRRRSSRR